MLPIVCTVLGFLWWWPIGLIILALFISRGRLGSWRHLAFAGDAPMVECGHGRDRWERKIVRMQEKMDVMRARADQVRSSARWFGAGTSGNRAFDDYRAETLRRLEEEQREFKDFLARLRFAKDRAEFDQFMAERRHGSVSPDSQAEPHG